MAKRIIVINSRSPIPKYRQIIDSIYKAIERKTLKKGDKVPSINTICTDFNMSRDTVMVAFNELKAKGILISQPGKGYYVATTDVKHEEKIFVLFDELTPSKADLFNSFIDSLKNRATVDIYFHNFNYNNFKSLITAGIGKYSSYVIMPSGFDNTQYLFSKIPKERIYILDRLKPDLKRCSVIYQDFEQDFYDALVSGDVLLKKYRKLIYVNPGGKEPKERVNAFMRFCKDYDFAFDVLKTLDGMRPSLYEAYFLPSDKDLIKLVKIARYYKLKLGKKFGIVSFNDTILKEVVAGGITTISTDFIEMGRTLAEMILERKNGKVRNPSKLIIRNSL